VRIIKELQEGGLGSPDCKGLSGGYGSKGGKERQTSGEMACEPHGAGGSELGKHEGKNTTLGISWLSNVQGMGGMELWKVAEAG